jgi:hypothetical protein
MFSMDINALRASKINYLPTQKINIFAPKNTSLENNKTN